MRGSEFIHDIPIDEKFGISLKLFRLDELHPVIQGNKYFKLLHNLEKAKNESLKIITMGGPHSNHIHATALACKSEQIPCYGIIRGENFNYLSPTLQEAQNLGMQLIYTDRETFRQIRDNEDFSLVDASFEDSANFHFIPEGGSNQLGVRGAEEILQGIELTYDYVFCPVGTGGTLSGIIRHLKGNKQIIGISALKDSYLNEQVEQFVEEAYDNWQINFKYHFGGYAKWDNKLIQFINTFKEKTGVPLCPIYTGKMMYGIYHLIENHFFPKGSSLLAIHTGGLQGISAFNQVNQGIIK